MTVLLNETLENELSKRYNELEEMNTQGNWTNEMEEREEILDSEIKDLQEAKNVFELQQ